MMASGNIDNGQHRNDNVELSDLETTSIHTGRTSLDIGINGEPPNSSREPLVISRRPNADLGRRRSHDEPNTRNWRGISSHTSLQPSSPGWLPLSCTFDGLITNWWLWELASWLLAAASVAAMAALLGYYNNDVVPMWSYGVTINTLVSVLATTLKVGLLFPLAEAISQFKWVWYKTCKRQSDFAKFDEASRGPLGAAVLFGYLKGRHVLTNLE